MFNISQNIHVSFLRTLPPYSHQADVWVEMLKQFKYRQLVFIHSSDTDGRALLGRFQTKTQDLQTDDQEVKVRSPTKQSALSSTKLLWCERVPLSQIFGSMKTFVF